MTAKKPGNIVQLTFTNNWENHEYRAEGKLISVMSKVYTKNPTHGAFEEVKIKSKYVGVDYNDMGHMYTAWSNHYYVEAVVLGVKVEIPLETLISKKPKMFFVDTSKVEFE